MVTSCEIKGLAGETLEKGHDHKSNRIRAFVDSQKRHAPAYASEGKKEFSRWIKNCRDEGIKTAKENPTKGIFSSPILKPRNAHCPSVIQQSTLPTSNEKASRKENRRDASEQGSARKIRPDKPVMKQKKRAVPPPVETDTAKLKAKLTAKANKKKRQRSESEDEREELLAQRRERRRRKKKIISPKTHDEGEGPKSQEEPKAIVLDDHKSKNNKSKLPAGLALMHGFNAENIGKQRLTKAPMLSSGVFSRGRASAKAKVEKKKASKVPGAFNELDFLNKISAPVPAKKRKPELHEKHSDLSASLSSIPSPRIREDNDSEYSGSTEVSLSIVPSRKPSVSQRSNDDKSDYVSQVWEIEKEFLKDDAGSGRSSIHEKPGSLVVNSREWDWCVSEAPGNDDSRLPKSLVAHPGRKEEVAIKSFSSTKTASTISPSQSASQTAAQASASANLHTTSKFFARHEDSSPSEGAPMKKVAPVEQHDPPSAEQASSVPVNAEQKTVNPPPGLTQEIELVSDKREQSAHREVKELIADDRRSYRPEVSTDSLEAEILSALGIQPGGPDVKIIGGEDYARVHFLADDLEASDLPSLNLPLFGQRSWDFDTCDAITDNFAEDEEYSNFFKTDDASVLEPDAVQASDLPEYTRYEGLDCACGYDCADSDYLHSGDLARTPPNDEEYYLYVYSQDSLANDLEDGCCYTYDFDTDLPEEASICPGPPGTYDMSDRHNGESVIDTDDAQEGAYLDDSISEDLTDIFPSCHGPLESAVHLFDVTGTASRPVGSLKEAEVAVAKEFQKKFYPIRF